MTLVLALACHISAALGRKGMGSVTFQFPLDDRDIDERETYSGGEKRNCIFILGLFPSQSSGIRLSHSSFVPLATFASPGILGRKKTISTYLFWEIRLN